MIAEANFHETESSLPKPGALILRIHGAPVHRIDLKEGLSIGSTSGMDLRLHREGIAPLHCLCTLDEHGNWLVVEMGDGVTLEIDGQAVRHAQAIRCGDVISLGAGCTLQVREATPRERNHRASRVFGAPKARQRLCSPSSSLSVKMD